MSKQRYGSIADFPNVVHVTAKMIEQSNIPGWELSEKTIRENRAIDENIARTMRSDFLVGPIQCH